MKWVGLTGGIGSGKSTVSRLLREQGIPVVDADQLARQALSRGERGYNEVVKSFGESILDEELEIDRGRLGSLIFADASMRRELEKIVHPIVQSGALKRRLELEQQGFELGFYDVPLLYEKQLEDQFDFVVVVICSEEQQRDRLSSRDGLSDEEISKRLSAQMPLGEKARRADFQVDNRGSLAELKQNVVIVLRALESKEQKM